jgi:DNA polymerase elongation subunit (family B)
MGMTERKIRGWIIDAYIQGDAAVLWVRTENGEAVRLTDDYSPSFYLKPKEDSHEAIMELSALLSTHPNISCVEEEKKHVDLSNRKVEVLHVHVDSLYNYRKVLEDLERLDRIESLYNVDLLHIQRYLFSKDIPPTCKAELTITEERHLSSIRILDDSMEIKPPPFKTLTFDIQVSSMKLSPEVEKDPIREVIINDGEETRRFGGDEEEILRDFQEYISQSDPDILVSDGVDEKLTYIHRRAKRRGFNLQLGRERIDILSLKRISPYLIRGRIPIDLHTYRSIGLAGISERCRFAYIPPGLAARWASGRIIDSGQCYEALKNDVLIPHSSFKIHVKTMRETIYSDRGGLILSPKVGLHSNVAALDFESMYPNIIVKYNVSYETATPKGIKEGREGLLARLTRKILDRRLHYKHLREKFPRDSVEWLWCEQRQTALKGILVCIYGYSACFMNRFSNLSCYEQINRLGRENLVKALNIALNDGFEVIYADSDSLFVKKKGADKREFKKLAEKIHTETGLPIALDKHFKFLVLLSQEADPDMEAARRYYGKLSNGELYYRGIELRRHDTPLYIKEFQARLIETLLNAESEEEILNERFREAFDIVVETCDHIMSGEASPEELIINKNLRKPVAEYKSLSPHVVAAIQMAQKGKRLRNGEQISFLYINAEHRNPFRRVVPAEVMDKRRRYYDREKYVEMVLDAAETVLGVFGFKRSRLGYGSRPKSYIEHRILEEKMEFLEELEDLTRYFR